ncbi:uncharacterized protein LOC103316981 [Nasonia vitripennis]|uniref:Uncharacterized protein n=1 Tax=Nasonia vitripennis TaxID=7425 RepID=A0A7M7LRK0_NASVI|nr:uncharacterized protein LOC103316981 [Nasonia vitripennis]
MSRLEEAKSEELRVYRQDCNSEEREELAAVGTKSEEDYNEESIEATGKFFNGNARIVIVPKILESSTNQSDDQPDDKDDGAIGKRSGNPRLKRGTIYFFDCLVAALVVGPMVVAHWRGIWVLMDFHQDIFTGWLCFGLGMSLHFLFAVLKQPLHRAFAQDASSKGLCARLGCRLIRTVYIYLFSLACNCHWRGVWILLNDLFGVQAG